LLVVNIPATLQRGKDPEAAVLYKFINNRPNIIIVVRPTTEIGMIG